MTNTKAISFIRMILCSSFVLGLIIQGMGLLLLIEYSQKYSFVTPFVHATSKYSYLIGFGLYISILLAGIYGFLQTFYKKSENGFTNILLLLNNTIIVTSIRLLYQVFSGKVNDSGIVIQNKFYTIYYNFSLEEKLEWYTRFVKETNRNIVDLNLFILNESKNYTQFKQLLSKNLEQLQQNSSSVITLSDIYNKMSSLSHWGIGLTGVLLAAMLVFNISQKQSISDMVDDILLKLIEFLGNADKSDD